MGSMSQKKELQKELDIYDAYQKEKEQSEINKAQLEINKQSNDNHNKKKDDEKQNEIENTNAKDQAKTWDFCKLLKNSKHISDLIKSVDTTSNTLSDIYDYSSFPDLSAEQIEQYEHILKECIELVLKYHAKTMDDAMIASLKAFSDQFSIQICESVVILPDNR